MKIETSIKPRRNGTLNVATPSGKVIVFSALGGRLTAEVADSADVQFLLGMSDFLPADEDGFLGSEPKFAEPSARPSGAVLRTAAKLVSDPNNPLIRGETGLEELGDDLPDDDGDENAAPVETATAPKPGKYTKKPK